MGRTGLISVRLSFDMRLECRVVSQPNRRALKAVSETEGARIETQAMLKHRLGESRGEGDGSITQTIIIRC